jgi:hypothetical protein
MAFILVKPIVFFPKHSQWDPRLHYTHVVLYPPLIPTSPISRGNPLSCNATQIEEAEGAWRRDSGGCEVGALFLVLVLLLVR